MLQLVLAPPPPPEYCLLWADRWWPGADPWWLCMQKAEWSGWAQAVGAVLAIAAAIGVAYIQHRQNLAQQRIAAAAERSRVLGGPLAVAERTIWRMEDYLRSLKRSNGADGSWGAPDGMKADLERMVDTFNALQLESLPSYELVHAAQEVKDGLNEARDLLILMGQKKSGLGTITRAEVGQIEDSFASTKESLDTLLIEWRQARSAEKGFQVSGQVTRVHDVRHQTPSENKLS